MYAHFLSATRTTALVIKPLSSSFPILRPVSVESSTPLIYAQYAKSLHIADNSVTSSNEKGLMLGEKNSSSGVRRR